MIPISLYLISFMSCEELSNFLFQREQELQEEKQASRKRKSDAAPASNYQEKYHHLIGKEAALDAARVTQTNKQYGFGKKHPRVPFSCMLLYKSLSIPHFFFCFLGCSSK